MSARCHWLPHPRGCPGNVWGEDGLPPPARKQSGSRAGGRDWGWPVCPPQSLELGEGMSTPAAEHLTERCVAVSPSLGPGHRRGHTRNSPSPSLTFITLSRGRAAAPRGRSAVGGA